MTTTQAKSKGANLKDDDPQDEQPGCLIVFLLLALVIGITAVSLNHFVPAAWEFIQGIFQWEI